MYAQSKLLFCHEVFEKCLDKVLHNVGQSSIPMNLCIRWLFLQYIHGRCDSKQSGEQLNHVVNDLKSMWFKFNVACNMTMIAWAVWQFLADYWFLIKEGDTHNIMFPYIHVHFQGSDYYDNNDYYVQKVKTNWIWLKIHTFTNFI